jgi:mono/diheme cytochrome c family protein
LFLARPEGDAELLPAPRGTLMSLAVHPNSPNILLLGGHTPEKGNLGVLRSTDGGLSWKKISGIGSGQVGFHIMEISKANPDVVYGISDALNLSADGGRTWRTAGPLPQELFHFAASSLRADKIFAATQRGLLVYRGTGAKWEPIHPMKHPATMIHVTPRGRLFAFVVGVGLITAKEENLSWSVLSNRFQDRVLLRMAIDPSDPNRLYAVTYTGAVVTSRDGGKSWLAFEGSHNANPGKISRGRKLFGELCKSCHGSNGQGGIPENPAPALDDSAHAWHHSDRGLVKTILEGSPRQGSPMIAWKHLLSRKDAEGIVAYLKSSWSFRSIACQGARHMACMRRR